MALPYVKLDTPRVRQGDYGYALTGTVYEDRNLQTAKDITGYNLRIHIYDFFRGTDLFGKIASPVSETDGTWTYTVLKGDMVPDGFYRFDIELTKTGEILTARYDGDFVVERNPTSAELPTVSSVADSALLLDGQTLLLDGNQLVLN